jgi:transposase
VKYVGIDLHKKSISVCVVDQTKKVLDRRRFGCSSPKLIRGYFQSLGVFRAVVEATASYEWLFALLDPLGQGLVLAHPGKMRVIAESVKKSDRLDAQVLAEFLAMDVIPQAHRPSPRQRELRRLTRHRVDLVRDRGRIQTKIRWIVANYNEDHPGMFTIAGRAWLQSTDVSPSDRFALNQLLATWEHLSTQIAQTQKQIDHLEATATDEEKERRRLLQSVPGVGQTIANTFLAEVGDASRFRSGKRLAAYVGLVPARRESAGKSKDLAITKQGSRHLRWAMIQAAWQAVRYSLYWRTVFEALAKRKGNKRAVVAIARRLLVVMHRLLVTGQPYDIGRIQESARASSSTKVARPKGAPKRSSTKVVARQIDQEMVTT